MLLFMFIILHDGTIVLKDFFFFLKRLIGLLLKMAFDRNDVLALVVALALIGLVVFLIVTFGHEKYFWQGAATTFIWIIVLFYFRKEIF